MDRGDETYLRGVREGLLRFLEAATELPCGFGSQLMAIYERLKRETTEPVEATLHDGDCKQ